VQQVRPKGLRVITGGDRRGGATSAKPKLLDQMRDALRSRHYSRSTERYCFSWVKRLILFHVRTTMIYTHVLNRGGKGVRSPVDALSASLAVRVIRKPYNTHGKWERDCNSLS
jgi:hypothetical protein